MSDSAVAGLESGREALRRFLAGDDELTTMLTKVALVATETVPGADIASITLVRDGTPATPVFTDKTALELDEMQYAIGDGPCLAAIRHMGVEQVHMESDSRWPDFTSAATAKGVTATVSAPLVEGEAAVGALNLYSKTVDVFGRDAQETASLLADQLGVAAARATMLAEGFELAQQLKQAIESRAAIEQAKGIIMAQSNVGPDEAFEILRRSSQRQNRKLRAIAEEKVAKYETHNG